MSDPIRKIAIRNRLTIPKKMINNDKTGNKLCIKLVHEQLENAGDDKAQKNKCTEGNCQNWKYIV